MSISFAAPAKINLALHVTGRRADGYHLLDTLVVFTEFGDRVRVSPADRDEFSASGPFAQDVPLDGTNLVLRARDLLRECFPEITRQPVRIALEKNLPASSGIGGGSSDAAAALKALTQFWNVEIAETELARVALPLGADLPMCIAARPLIARGVGEELVPVAGLPALPMLLVNPGVPVSTPEVFRHLGSRENPPLHPLPPSPSAAGLAAWLAATRNDLETPAVMLAPRIAETLAAIWRSDALFARMSGSGATCFGIFETIAKAEEAAARLKADRPTWWAIATTACPSEDENARN